MVGEEVGGADESERELDDGRSESEDAAVE